MPLQPTPLYESMWVLSLPVWHNSGQPGTQLWLQRSLVGTNSAPGKERKKRTQFHLLYPEMMLWYCINIFCKFVQCITTQYTYLFFMACNGVKCILRSKQQSTLPPLLLLFLIVPSLPLQLLLTVRIKLPDVVLDTNMSHMIKKKSIWCQTKCIVTSHTHHSYLQQLLGVLQEVQTVFDPASGNICPLLPELFPTLALRLTWIRKWDTRMWDHRKNTENERFWTDTHSP